MCGEAVRIEPYTLEFDPDRLKTQETCRSSSHRAILTGICVSDWPHIFLSLTTATYKRCALQQSRHTHGTWPTFLITLKPKRSVMMQDVGTDTRWNLFLIVTLNCKKCGMRTLIMMMNLLSGAMAINNARPRKHK